MCNEAQCILLMVIVRYNNRIPLFTGRQTVTTRRSGVRCSVEAMSIDKAMPRTPKPRPAQPFIVRQVGGHRFPDLESAQRAALRPLAADVAASIRKLLATGVLVIVDGRITTPSKPQQ